ncbi:hypothetical protein INT48_009167 [Thamnidium elegans]|uniref:UBC core domain-containing protein n=1 Tax=Thamnidium elegans TaxID=101142 RepID=A0A8H7SWU7_9FUNG|nr:hypothetical protein INT48_009167 [Thamnidium elegans]
MTVLSGKAIKHGTPYHDGYFKVRLTLDENFPDTPPKGNFITKIFHPNVSPTGEICVNTLKKDWKPELGVEHVLLTIKCLLIVPNPESALNEEAGKLLLEQYDDYAKRARLYTSIQAKSGKNEFLQLEKDRLTDKTKENATVKKGLFTPSVLKPLSDTTELNTKKRQGEDNTEEKEVKKVKKSIVKKKALRRL